MLKINSISKEFEERTVLDSINLNVQSGSIFALVGPNGAGKTTLLRTIMGIIFPDQGQITFQGQDILAQPHLKAQVAYIPEVHHFYPDFTGKKLAGLFRRSYHTWDEERYQQLQQTFKLPQKKKFKSFSKGMKTQMAFLLNLAINPKLLILDEPTSGLDPIIRKQVLNLIVDQVASQGTTVVISSHNLMELERICDSFGILSQGQVLLSEQVDNLKEDIHKVQVAFAGEIPEEIAQHPGLLSAEQMGKVHTLVIRDSQLLSVIQNAEPIFFEKLDVSMEEIFLSVLGGYTNDQ